MIYPLLFSPYYVWLYLFNSTQSLIFSMISRLLLVQATFSGTNGLLRKLQFRMAFFLVVECFHSCVPSPSRLFPFWKLNGFFKFGWMLFHLNYSVIDGERWIMLWNRHSENTRGIFHFLPTSVFSLFCVFSFHNKTRRWQLYLNRARRPTLKKAEAMVLWNTTQNIRRRSR